MQVTFEPRLAIEGLDFEFLHDLGFDVLNREQIGVVVIDEFDFIVPEAAALDEAVKLLLLLVAVVAVFVLQLDPGVVCGLRRVRTKHVG